MQEGDCMSFLRLVHNFQEQSYPKRLEIFLDAHFPLNKDYVMNIAIQRDGALKKVQQAASLAGISDYQILDLPNKVALLLKTEEDLFMANIAMHPHQEIEIDFIHASQNFDPRKLKNTRHRLQRIIDQSDLRGSVLFTMHASRRTISVHAENRQEFFRMKDLLSTLDGLSPLQPSF